MRLTEENYLIYAMHNYQAPSCPTLEEFENDLKLVTYIKKNLLKDEININLTLNQIIIFFNCFGDAALHLLFFKIDRSLWSKLCTFLLYINRLPDVIPEYDFTLSSVGIDLDIANQLRKL